MVFELHRGPTRAPSWATLPRLATHAAEFDAALRNTSAADLARRIDELFRVFEADLDGIADLTDPDKAAIRALAADELRKRVGKIGDGGIIDEKGFGEDLRINPRSFRPSDFAELPMGTPLPSRATGLAVVN